MMIVLSLPLAFPLQPPRPQPLDPSTVDALIQELQNRRAELKAQISAIYNDKRKTLERQKNYLDRCMVRFDCAADFTRLLLEQVCVRV
jgi:hypothetical protein